MPKQWYDVQIGDQWEQVEADSPEQAAEIVKQHPLWKATQGMPKGETKDSPADDKAARRAAWLTHQGPLTQIMERGVGPFVEGFGKQAGDMVSGLKALPGAMYADPVGTSASIGAGILRTPLTIGEHIASGDPEQLGRVGFDAASMLVPMGRPGLSGAGVAAKVGGKAVAAGDTALEAAKDFAVAHPSVPAIAGAGAGYAAGGWPGLVSGLTGGGAVGALMKKFLTKEAEDVKPNPNAGGSLTANPQGTRLVTPGVPVEETIVDALNSLRREKGVEVAPSHPIGGGANYAPPSKNVGGRLAAGDRPSLEQALADALESAGTPEGVELAPSHPQGGGFTVGEPKSPNAGGRLAPASPRPQTVEALLADAMKSHPPAVEMAASHPTGGGFSIPGGSATGRRTADSAQMLADALKKLQGGSPELQKVVEDVAAAKPVSPKAPPVRPTDPNPTTAEFFGLEAERKAAEDAAGITPRLKKSSPAAIPASRSRRTPMSATPGLTVNDVAVLGMNPELPITGLTEKAISDILRARLARTGQYRTEAAMAKELARLMADIKK